MFIIFPLLISHIIIVLSSLPLANNPSGKTAKQYTLSVWPDNVFILFPLLISHIIIVLSRLPLANNPSGRFIKKIFNLLIFKINNYKLNLWN